MVGDSGTETQGSVIGIARRVELTESGLAGSIACVGERQTNWVLPGVEAVDGTLELCCSGSEFEKKEVAVCFGIPQDWWNVHSKLTDRMLGLAANSNHSCFVTRVYTGSSAFEERATD